MMSEGRRSEDDALSNRPHPFYASIPLHPYQPEPANAIETPATLVSRSMIPTHLKAFPQGVDGEYIDHPEHVYQRVTWLLKFLCQRPQTVRCAADACEGEHRHAQGKGGHG
jgi:hypothetical protein